MQALDLLKWNYISLKKKAWRGERFFIINFG